LKADALLAKTEASIRIGKGARLQADKSAQEARQRWIEYEASEQELQLREMRDLEELKASIEKAEKRTLRAELALRNQYLFYF